MRQPEIEQITSEQLLQQGFIEDLVNSNRFPWLVKTEAGEIICYIPPQGVQKSDSHRYKGPAENGCSFYTAEGRLIGEASYLILDDTSANELVGRRNATVRELEEGFNR